MCLYSAVEQELSKFNRMHEALSILANPGVQGRMNNKEKEQYSAGKQAERNKKMFSQMVEILSGGARPDSRTLRQRFEMAVIKKLGVVRLPPAFRMRDPKVNPRIDHLLWAALLLGDREKVDIVLSIMAIETAEEKKTEPLREHLEERVKELVDRLAGFSPDPAERRRLLEEFWQLIPEWLPGAEQPDNG